MKDSIENKFIKKLIGSPYFIMTNDQENFYIVNSVHSNVKESWSYDFDDQELILGRDIIEVSTRKLILGVECPTSIKIGFSIVEECRKLAKLCLYDYVSTKFINGTSSSNRVSLQYSIVYPRLFRKIIDN